MGRRVYVCPWGTSQHPLSTANITPASAQATSAGAEPGVRQKPIGESSHPTSLSLASDWFKKEPVTATETQ